MSRRDFLKLLPLGLYSAGSIFPILPQSKLNARPPFFPIGPTIFDVLSDRQKRTLVSASKHFLAPDEESANRVALEIDFIEGLNEHASNMCGPLSISILRRAALLGSWVEPRDFWLLNPREDLRTASNVFPNHLYDWFHFIEPIAQFDFFNFPLQAGDLLYLHGNQSDTFEHILAVNEVDHFGRAYTISNFFTDKGTVIEQRLLYDPNNQAAGQFKRWADRSIRNTIGNTGGAGFRVWRVKNGQRLFFPNDENSRTLRQSLDELFLAGQGRWYAEIREQSGRTIYQFNPFEAIHPASTIKLPIAMAFMNWFEEQLITDKQAYLSSKGTSGRSFQQLMQAMLVESEEEATEIIVQFLDPLWIEAIWSSWDFSRTKVNPRRSSAFELLNFFTELHDGKWLSMNSRSYLLNFLAEFSPNDETRIGLIKDSLSPDTIIYNKRGSLVEAPRILSDTGILSIPASSGGERRKILFSFHGLGKDASSYESLEAILDQAIYIFGDYLTSA